jgi:hypothetical protein
LAQSGNFLHHNAPRRTVRCCYGCTLRTPHHTTSHHITSTSKPLPTECFVLRWGQHQVLVHHLLAGQLLPRNLSHAPAGPTTSEACSDDQCDRHSYGSSNSTKSPASGTAIVSHPMSQVGRVREAVCA